jgi:hypothetical protein
MNEFPRLAAAMLAIALVAVMLVTGQLVIEKRDVAAPAELTASVPGVKPFANLPQ